MLLTLAFCLFLNPEVEHISETEIYRPLVLGEIAVTEKGEIFIVQRKEATVLKFSAEGELETKLGTRGQGPGEFALPTWIYYRDDHVYVEDANQNRVSCFTTDGKFKYSVILPSKNLQLVKVKNGWVYGDWETTRDLTGPASLMLVDDKFENPKKLLSWSRPEEETSRSIQTDGDTVPKVPINPVTPRAFLAASKDGMFAYFIRNGATEIEIFDLVKGEAIEKLPLKTAKPIPFNDAWGEDMVRRLSEAITGGNKNFPIKFVPDPPDYFPLVRDFFVNPNDEMCAVFWTGVPDKQHNIQYFDNKRKGITSKLDAAAMDRWVGSSKGYAFITYFDQEMEEGRIAKVPMAEVNQFVKNNPIIFEGLPGYAVLNID